MEDPIAIEEQVYQCGCNVNDDNDEQRPFSQAPTARTAAEPTGASIGKGAVKNNDMDQPLNEANAQPVIVVANTST